NSHNSTSLIEAFNIDRSSKDPESQNFPRSSMSSADMVSPNSVRPRDVRFQPDSQRSLDPTSASWAKQHAARANALLGHQQRVGPWHTSQPRCFRRAIQMIGSDHLL